MPHNLNSQMVGDVPQPVEYLPDSGVRLVDQTLLPLRLEYLDCGSVEELAEAIRSMKVRGAPAIGVAAAYGLDLAAHLSTASDTASLVADLEGAARILGSTRPTAVNLFWALETVLESARSTPGGVQDVKDAVHQEATRIDYQNQIRRIRPRNSLSTGQPEAEPITESMPQSGHSAVVPSSVQSSMRAGSPGLSQRARDAPCGGRCASGRPSEARGWGEGQIRAT